MGLSVRRYVSEEVSTIGMADISMTQEDFSPTETRPEESETSKMETSFPGHPDSGGRNRQSRNHGRLFSVALIGVLSGAIGCFLVLFSIPTIFSSQWFRPVLEWSGITQWPDRMPPQEQKEIVRINDEEVVNTVEATNPSVVSIVISKDVPRLRQPEFFGFPFFSPFDGGNSREQNGGTEKQTVGAGSGFFVSSDGLIATNKHVVSDAVADYTVITTDGKEHPAKIIAKDPVRDVALIQVEGSGFPALSLGDSSAVKIGQTVIAIGNSLGEFSNTVSKGIISGLQRDLTAGGQGGDAERLNDILQTDAAINPGNSGGPLLDIAGRVIGINVAMAEGAQNIGFAIPIDQVKKIIDQVQKTGKISTPFIGIRYVIIDEQVQKENDLPFGYGAIIARGAKQTDFAVVPGSPADKAGLVENDIILEIEGKRIDIDNSLVEILSEHDPGETVTLKVWHKGETRDVKIVVGEKK